MLHCYSLPPLLHPTNPASACFPRHQATAAGAYAPDSSGAAEARHGREQGSNAPPVATPDDRKYMGKAVTLIITT
jgi:hypothetical protein